MIYIYMYLYPADYHNLMQALPPMLSRRVGAAARSSGRRGEWSPLVPDQFLVSLNSVNKLADHS